MANYIQKKGWQISENLATPESVYLTRRGFIQGTALTSLATVGSLYGCGPSTIPKNLPEIEWNETEKSIYPTKHNPEFELDRPITDEKIAGTYNNFYEFGADKIDPVHNAQKINTRPWKVEVTGLVNKPKSFDIDDMLKATPIEERLYRLRCVEAWAMAVPWTGFAFKELLKLVDPKSSATHVKMETFINPSPRKDSWLFGNHGPIQKL